MIDYNAGPIPSLEEIAERLNGPIKEGPPDIIPGLLPSDGQLILAGQTNVGKTLLNLEIISAVTTGKPLWGELEPIRRCKKVLYVLGEHNTEEIKRQLKFTRLEMPDQVFILGPDKLMWDKCLVTKGGQNVQAVNKFMKWAQGCDLIVFDPIASFIHGESAENDNVQMRLVLETMSMIAQSTNASCIVNAHLGKPMMNQYGQETKRQTYAIRGASAIEDSASTVFYFDKASNPAIEQSTGGEVFELVCRKNKGVRQEKFSLLRNKETSTHTLISGNTFEAVRKIDLRAKFARFQDDNPKFDDHTIIKMIATSEGKSPDTVRRWMGLLVD